MQNSAGSEIYRAEKTKISQAINLGACATLLQAETYAILFCAILLKNKSYVNRRIIILTESDNAKGIGKHNMGTRTLNYRRKL